MTAFFQEKASEASARIHNPRNKYMRFDRALRKAASTACALTASQYASVWPKVLFSGKVLSS